MKTWYSREIPSQPVSWQQDTSLQKQGHQYNHFSVLVAEFSFFKSTVVQPKLEIWNQYVSVWLVQPGHFRRKRWNVEVHYQKVLSCFGTYLCCHTEPTFHFFLKLLQNSSRRYIKSHFGNVKWIRHIFWKVFWVSNWP